MHAVKSFLTILFATVSTGTLFAADPAPTDAAAATSSKPVEAKIREEMTQERWAKMTPAQQYSFNFKNTYRDNMCANVDGKIILLGDLRELTYRYDLLLKKEAKTNDEYRQKRDRLFFDTLSNLTEQYLLVAEFKELPQYTYVDEMINEQIKVQIDERIEQNFDGDRGKYLMYLRAKGITPEEEKKKMKDIIIAQEQSRQIISTMRQEVSPLLVQQFYKANLESYREAEMIEYARIVIVAGASETDDMIAIAAKNLAERLRQDPNDFSNSAKIYSRDDWRSAGGYVGWVPSKDLSEPLVNALKAVKNGEVADLVELPSATGGKMYVILKRINYREPGVKPLDELRPQIENILRGQMHQQIRSEKLENLKNRYYHYWFY